MRTSQECPHGFPLRPEDAGDGWLVDRPEACRLCAASDWSTARYRPIEKKAEGGS